MHRLVNLAGSVARSRHNPSQNSAEHETSNSNIDNNTILHTERDIPAAVSEVEPPGPPLTNGSHASQAAAGGETIQDAENGLENGSTISKFQVNISCS